MYYILGRTYFRSHLLWFKQTRHQVVNELPSIWMVASRQLHFGHQDVASFIRQLKTTFIYKLKHMYTWQLIVDTIINFLYIDNFLISQRETSCRGDMWRQQVLLFSSYVSVSPSVCQSSAFLSSVSPRLRFPHRGQPQASAPGVRVRHARLIHRARAGPATCCGCGHPGSPDSVWRTLSLCKSVRSVSSPSSVLSVCSGLSISIWETYSTTLA